MYSLQGGPGGPELYKSGLCGVVGSGAGVCKLVQAIRYLCFVEGWDLPGDD